MPVATRERATKLVCGCGYLGERVARSWLVEGHKVFATTRSVDRATQLSRMGIQPLVVDIRQPLPCEKIQGVLPSVDTVLFAVGFDRTSGQTIHEVYVQGLSNFLDSLPTSVERLIYISSTGVYGQGTGEWVDESSPCDPQTRGGEACLAAERLLGKHRLANRSVILRLAGIYGPGRIPKLAAIQAGEPIESAETGFLNLIYIDDAVRAIMAAETLSMTPRLFTVSDGQPVLRGEFYRELARLLNAPPPKFHPPREGSSAAIRSSTDKRVSNRRMLEELKVALQIPSYREGLAAIVRGT